MALLARDTSLASLLLGGLDPSLQRKVCLLQTLPAVFLQLTIYNQIGSIAMWKIIAAAPSWNGGTAALALQLAESAAMTDGTTLERYLKIVDCTSHSLDHEDLQFSAALLQKLKAFTEILVSTSTNPQKPTSRHELDHVHKWFVAPSLALTPY